MSAAPNKQVQVVSQDELLKSLKNAAGITEEPAANAEIVQVAAQVPAAAPAAEVLKTKGSEGLQKALDVSDVLSEFAQVMTDHIDATLTELRKSVQQGSDRDLLIVKAIEGLKKSLDTNTEEIKKYGAGVAASTTARQTGGTVTLLRKAAAGDQPEEVQLDPVQLRKHVQRGIEKMMKGMAAGSPELANLTRQTSLYEAGGKVPESFIREALKAAGVDVKTA